jgi:threonine dehydratase
VEPSDANAMALSLHHGQRVILDQVGGFADGVAVKEVGEEPFRICKELVDGVVLVSRDAICASIKVRLLSCFRLCTSFFVSKSWLCIEDCSRVR